MYRYTICPCAAAGQSAATYKVRLRYLRKDLLYDIGNIAYVESHVMDEGSEHARHTLADICDDGNVDRVTRILDVVHAAVVEILYPYTKLDPLEEEELTDEFRESEEYVIEMKIPQTFSRTTINLLSKLIHEYMVYRVIHDWLTITNRDAAPPWLEKAQEALDEISRIKNLRTGVLRRKPYPF